MPPFQSVRKRSKERTVARDAAIALNRGNNDPQCNISFLALIHARRILRAFLVEEAKIVKKVIKQQQKAGRK